MTSTNPTIATRLTNSVTRRLSTRQHAAAAASSLIALGASNAILNSSYAASGHPVPYAEGQLAFSAEAIRGYYSHMQELGTLGVYSQTQLIDFAFIGSVAAVGFFVATLMARLSGRGTRQGNVASWAAIMLLVGASFDVIENLISFVMLADPQGFAEPLALLYSGVAATKFAAMVPAVLLLVASIPGLIVRGLRNLGRRPSAAPVSV